jgi:hypothetical protein
MNRRRFQHLAIGAAALPIVSQPGRAQTYPVRPVGFAAAGGNDIVGFRGDRFLRAHVNRDQLSH